MAWKKKTSFYGQKSKRLPFPWDWLDPGHCRVIIASYHAQLDTNIVRAQFRVEWERFALVLLVLENRYRALAGMQRGWEIKRNKTTGFQYVTELIVDMQSRPFCTLKVKRAKGRES